MRALLATLTVVLFSYASAFAHTPQKCVALFHEAAKINQDAVDWGERVQGTSLEMLDSRVGSHRDRYRRYDSNRVEKHADLLAQFWGRLTKRDLAIAEAVKCVDGQGATPAKAKAPDYRAEIIEHAIEPCLLAKVRQQGLDKTLGEAKALSLMKLMTKKSTERSVRALEPIVRGKNWKSRKALYGQSAAICAKSK